MIKFDIGIYDLNDIFREEDCFQKFILTKKKPASSAIKHLK